MTTSATHERIAQTSGPAATGASTLVTFFNGTVLLTILTWTAYLIGFVYHETYLARLGITPELYPKGAETYFIYAFYACHVLLSKLLPFLTNEAVVFVGIFLFCLFICIVNAFFKHLERSNWAAKVRQRLEHRSRVRATFVSVTISMLASFLTFYVPLTFMFATSFPILIGASAAGYEADNILEKTAKGCVPYANERFGCAEITDKGNVIAKGIVIEASGNYIALIDGSNSRSIRLEGREIVRHRVTQSK